MILNSVEFKSDFRCYKKGHKINLNNNLTIISGDNGSGKSTLISCIRKEFKTDWSMSDDPQSENVVCVDTNNSKQIKIAYLCFSSDMLKNSSAFDDDIQLHIRVMRLSSGQGALEQLVCKIERNKHLPLLILDEPEKGLSIKRVLLIRKYLQKHIEDNPEQQIIIITHSTILMSLNEELYSTSHKKYITKSEYLEWMYDHKSMSEFDD